MTVQGEFRIGKISKPYGLRGEVQIILNPGSASHIKEGIPLFIDLDGQRVPFYIEGAELISSDQAIAKLEFINSVDEARGVSGCDVFLESGTVEGPVTGPGNPGDMIGYSVTDLELGDIGKITKYLHSEMNPVWHIEYRGNDLLVPAVDEFILKIDHRKKKIHLKLPEGLTEL